jgi:hypothetical protein
MSPSQRVGTWLNLTVHDQSGEPLGRIADVETERDEDGRERVVAVLVTVPPWGRLLGYEREQVDGPWLLEWFARTVLRRNMRRVPWEQVQMPDVEE